MLAQERRQDLVFPHPPRLRISGRPAWSFQTTPEPLPCFAAFVYPDSGIPVLSNPFYTLEKVMIHKAGESEEATPLCFKDCALKIGLDRTRFQIILMNAITFAISVWSPIVQCLAGTDR